MIAALFVQKNGCYFGLDDVDPWDEERDARKYAGPYPVVAHPPCQLWGKMSLVNFSRYGGDHNKPGNDGGLFEFALQCVNKFGGVLEHPAQSRAFFSYGLPFPRGTGWVKWRDSWVCEVWQSAYGHKANKATWLYYNGNERPFSLRWERPRGTHQIANDGKRATNKPMLNKREASATPIEFRDELIALAKHSALIDVSGDRLIAKYVRAPC